MTPADYIEKWVGVLEGSSGHHLIIDTYNQISPLPSGYKVKYTDAWCAATVSAAYHMAGLDSIFPSECSCGRMLNLAKKMGIWVENDAYIPKRNDCVLYDWGDSGTGDCTGAPDHVGMVVAVIDGYINVIEGNYNGSPDRVGLRKLKLNGKYIRGFITPKVPDNYGQTKKSTREIALEVINGEWGCGNTRRQKLEAAGYNYSEVQSMVNKILKG